MVVGIYSTIDNIIPSRNNKDINKWDVFIINDSKININDNINKLFISIELRCWDQSSIYKIVASIKLSILFSSVYQINEI